MCGTAAPIAGGANGREAATSRSAIPRHQVLSTESPPHAEARLVLNSRYHTKRFAGFSLGYTLWDVLSHLPERGDVHGIS